MCAHHKVKCKFCRRKVDVEELIENEEYETVPYYKTDRNKEWIAFGCPFCNQDNLYVRILNENENMGEAI